MTDLQPHLWDMPTSWFPRPDNEHINSTYSYKSWKDFQECKPYKLWKPYILSSWSWKVQKEEILQQKKYEKRADKHVLDCTAMLRSNPSEYDKQKNSSNHSNANEVEMLQIVFISPDRFKGMHRVEMRIQKENEDEIRQWLKGHMPTFWKL
jgi:hypothetical protein